MNNKLIIFPNDKGHLTFVYPAPECPLSLEEIAAKDIPAGKPYLFVDYEFVPKDHTFFGAFDADFTNPDGYGIGADAYLAAKEAEQ